MARCLIVANQTLGGDALHDAVRERITRGDREFYVLVPMTPIRQQTADWAGGFQDREGTSLDELVAVRRAMEQDEQLRAVAFDQERRRAEGRLGRMIDAIWAAGGQAEGEVADADPVVAIVGALERESFDEIVISTLPRDLSRWLRMGVPDEVAEMTDAEVVTIEADA